MGDSFDAEAFKTEQLASKTKTSSFMLKYFNLHILLFLLFYTLLTKLIYAAHLVINSYVQGITFWVTTVMFVISIFTNPSIYFIALIFIIFHYLFAYDKLYELKIAESIL